MTRFKAILSILVLMAFLFVVGAVVIADSPPVVDGAIFGPGDGTASDYPTYTYQYDIRDGADDVIGYVYDYTSGSDYYAALVLDPDYSDNVFDGNVGTGVTYLDKVGWEKPNAHKFDDLLNSDGAEVELRCDNPSGGEVETISIGIDLIDCTDWNNDDVTCNSDWAVPLNGTALPPVSWATSTQWNMNNTENHTNDTDRWDVTLSGSRGNGTPPRSDLKSPDLHGDNGTTSPSWADAGESPGELGYVRTEPGSDWYDQVNFWEWPIVYEMKFDVSSCNGEFGIDATTVVLHSSPDKGNQGPNAVTMQKIEAVSQPSVQYNGVNGVTMLLLVGGAFVGFVQRRRNQRL